MNVIENTSLKEVHVPFKKWELVAWVNSKGEGEYVAVSPICDAIGVQSARQREKIQNNPKFSPTHMYWHDSSSQKQPKIGYKYYE